MTRSNKTENEEVFFIRLHHLGKVITQERADEFESIVRRNLSSRTIDITGWTEVAVRVLLKVCSEEEMPVTIKNGEKHSTIVRYPADGIDRQLVKLILSQQ